MLAASKSRGNAIPTDRSVREIVAVCAKHGIPFGEPGSLAEFVRSLQQNKHFAMDFWSVVARLGGDGSPDRLLAVIVEGVTGLTIAEVGATDPAAALLLSRLARILAGEDISGLEPFSPQAARDADPPTPRGQPSRLTLEPEFPGVSASTAPLGDGAAAFPLNPPQEPAREPQILIPLASYADRDREEVAPARLLAGVLVLALLAAGGYWLAHRRHSPNRQSLSASIRTGYTLADSTLHRAYLHLLRPHVRPTNSSATTPPAPTLAAVPQQSTAAPPNSPPPPESGPAQNHPTERDLSGSEATQSKSPLNAPPQNEPSRQPASTPRDSVNPVVLQAARGSEFDPNLAAPTAVEAVGATPTAEAGQVVVPEPLMKQRLISSRVPIYPPAAKENRMAAVVSIQAIVTRDGSVEPVRVVQGDPALRQAALQAVSTWKYRPYLLNGRPIDVSTVISVDFSASG
jgi:protein TonB